MQIKKNLIIKNRQENSYAKALRTHCLFSFFLVLFAWGQSAVFAAPPAEKSKGRNEQGFKASESFPKNSSTKVPDGSFPLPSDQENSDEHQLTEDFWESQLFEGEVESYDYDFSLFKSFNALIIHLAQSFQNRQCIALFILHHSWKSYLH
jgi:hypothetical protein